MKTKLSAIISTALILSSTSAIAVDFKDPLPKAMKDGKVYLDSRYRFEYVDDSNPTKPNIAKASTLRTRVGFTSGEILRDTIANIEFENISAIQDKSYYNDGSNGRTSYATVADPVGTELNQLYLQTRFIPKAILTFGRHNIELANERFVGDVGWRQNDQTFDGVSFDYNPIDQARIHYSYTEGINTVFGEDAPNGDIDTEVHLLHAEYDLSELFKFGTYAYFMDLMDSTANSNETYGAFINGKYTVNKSLNFDYRLEYAMQSDYESNPNSYDAGYYDVMANANFMGFTAGVDYSVQETDGGAGQVFRTPLATGHAFNGLADMFLTTPANGLEDLNFTLKYKHKDKNPYLHNITLMTRYHDFSAENGGGDYGSEIDVVLKKKINKNWYWGIKYAKFDADAAGGMNDKSKVATWLGVKLEQ